jgi:prophage regulatory protein
MLDLYSMSANTDPGDIIRIEQVLDTTGLSRTMLYQQIREGTFPCQVPLGARSVGWYKNQVDDWKRNRPVKQPQGKGVREDAHRKHGPTLRRPQTAPSTTSRGTRRKSTDSSANALHTDDNNKATMILLQGDSYVDQGVKRRHVVGNAKSLSVDSTKKELIEHLLAENARLKEVLADVELQNHKLQSGARHISIRS